MRLIEYVRHHPLYMAAFLVTLITLVGCGSDEIPVYPTEALLLLDDKPFGPTSIMLIPETEGGRSVAGSVNEEGKVVFTSYDPGDGAPAGEYRVAIGTVMAPPPAPFPIIYRDFKKSPLKVTIEPKEKNEVVIAMDSSIGKKTSGTGMTDGEMLRKAYDSDAFRAGAE